MLSPDQGQVSFSPSEVLELLSAQQVFLSKEPFKNGNLDNVGDFAKHYLSYISTHYQVCKTYRRKNDFY